MVEGVRRCVGGDRVCNGGWVFHDIRRWKAKNGQTAFAQPSIAAFIVLGLVVAVVDFTVDFDNKGGLAAEKINDVWADWMLAAELQSGGPLAEMLPENDFWRRHRPAELAGGVNRGLP